MQPKPKLPDICFGVSQLHSRVIRGRLALKGIRVSAVVRAHRLTYLGFATDTLHERAVRWIYRWYGDEIHGGLPHWAPRRARIPSRHQRPDRGHHHDIAG